MDLDMNFFFYPTTVGFMGTNATCLVEKCEVFSMGWREKIVWDGLT